MGGWILSNGEVRKKQRPSSNTSTFRKESAYIMQDDQLWPLFTVLEVMNMSANLKLGFSLSTKAKHLVFHDFTQVGLVVWTPVNISFLGKMGVPSGKPVKGRELGSKKIVAALSDIQILSEKRLNVCAAISRSPRRYLKALPEGVSSNNGGKCLTSDDVSQIDDILDTLGLNGTRTVACKDLSGGQKKKLSIALEMVDNPPVMFLDEPTTGLDSLSSLQCITMLKALARGGRTVVCTIHQPSATMLEMFDHVYMLAEGVCAYQGSSDNLVPFLSSVGLNCPQYHNPADYILEIASGEYGHFIQELAVATTSKCWRKHDELTGSVSEEQVTEEDEKTDSTKTMILIDTPSEYTKFWVLLYRCFVLLYRDWVSTPFTQVIPVT
uniref:ABC transporter domain-containing protein n=1 Tax=Timema bartmani TaxID=61472 RepID=A0A7R9I652_9NEOP|nr:unnamed protein product [Timema bartmani]